MTKTLMLASAAALAMGCFSAHVAGLTVGLPTDFTADLTSLLVAPVLPHS